MEFQRDGAFRHLMGTLRDFQENLDHARFLPYVITLEQKSHLKCDFVTMTYFVFAPWQGRGLGILVTHICRAQFSHWDVSGEGLAGWVHGCVMDGWVGDDGIGA